MVLILDEVLFLDLVVLNSISVRMQDLRGNSRPFGGLFVLALGDFHQKLCTFGIPLHRGLLMLCLSDEQLNELEINRAQNGKKAALSELGSDRRGAELIKTFRRFNLTQQMRAAKDPGHSGHLEGMRDTKSKQPVSDAFLKSLPILTKEAMERPDLNLKEAKIAALSWREIYPINLFKIFEFARGNNLPVIKWRKEVVGASASFLLADELDQLYVHENAGMHEFFVQGMPGTYTRNINVQNGIVNGADCKFVSLTPAEGSSSIEESISAAALEAKNWVDGVLVVFLSERPLSINTKPIVPELQRLALKKLKFTFDNKTIGKSADDDHFDDDDDSDDGADKETESEDLLPILLGKFSFDEYTSTSEWAAQESVPKLKYQRFDVIPFFACTDFKMQGRTVSSLIAVLGTRNFPPFITLSSLYVLASRVKIGSHFFALGLDKNDMDHLRKLKHPSTLVVWENAYDSNGLFSPAMARAEADLQIVNLRKSKAEAKFRKSSSFRRPSGNTTQPALRPGLAPVPEADKPPPSPFLSPLRTPTAKGTPGFQPPASIKTAAELLQIAVRSFSMNLCDQLCYQLAVDNLAAAGAANAAAKRPRGLKNFGYTCFSNSVFQALKASVHFSQFVEMLSGKIYMFSGQETPSVIFTEHLFYLLSDLSSSSSTVKLINTRTTNLLELFPKEFSNRFLQYDAHEFLKYVCNEVDNALTFATRGDAKSIVAAKCKASFHGTYFFNKVCQNCATPKVPTPFNGKYFLNKVCRNCATPKVPIADAFEDLSLEIVHDDASEAGQICVSGMITLLLFMFHPYK